MILKGIFQITDWQESAEKELNAGAKLSTALVQQSYDGDILGSSEVRYNLYYSKDGNAVFNGFEIITFTEDHQDAWLILKHTGKFNNGAASSQFIVIDGSNSRLLGKTGSFESMDGGKAHYQIAD